MLEDNGNGKIVGTSFSIVDTTDDEDYEDNNDE